MIGREYMRKVTVWGREVEVDISHRSMSVWIASGTVHDQHIEVKAASLGAAVIRWKDAADIQDRLSLASTLRLANR